MARYQFERPTSFAEGFLPSKYARPLPWPIGVQEEYDVAWHVRAEDPALDRGPAEAVAEEIRAEAPLRPVAVSGVVRWRHHRP
jgi:hypothetical protein